MKDNKFSSNLLRLRNSALLTQEELAIACDLPFTVISQYERGHREPNLTNLKKLYRGLGVSPNDLLL